MKQTKQTNPVAITVTSASVSGVDVVLQSISKLAEKRHAFITGEKKVGDLQRAYALQFNESFGANWWEAKGEIKKAVKAEYAALTEDLQGIGKTQNNIYKIWQRIQEEAGRVYATKNKATGGDTTGVDAKTIAELKTIYNRITDSTEDVSPLSYKIKTQLEDILDLLGVEI